MVGGGGPARAYQKAFRAIVPGSSNDEADWVGIMATRLNAQLLKAIFADICPGEVVYDPTKVEVFTGRIIVAAGWKPGFSTDNDAVLLAERFSASTVINLSNIAKVYTDDPAGESRGEADRRDQLGRFPARSSATSGFPARTCRSTRSRAYTPRRPASASSAPRAATSITCAISLTGKSSSERLLTD